MECSTDDSYGVTDWCTRTIHPGDWQTDAYILRAMWVIFSSVDFLYYLRSLCNYYTIDLFLSSLHHIWYSIQSEPFETELRSSSSWDTLSVVCHWCCQLHRTWLLVWRLLRGLTSTDAAIPLIRTSDSISLMTGIWFRKYRAPNIHTVCFIQE